MTAEDGIGSWRLLEHTADIRLEVTGSTHEALFLNAGMGLTSLLGADETLPAQEKQILQLTGEDAEDLLVSWLRELLYLSEVRDFILVDASFTHLTSTDLTAELSLRHSTEKDESDVEIKAVTYHGLKIEKSDRGYRAEVVFDI